MGGLSTQFSDDAAITVPGSGTAHREDCGFVTANAGRVGIDHAQHVASPLFLQDGDQSIGIRGIARAHVTDGLTL